VGAAESLAATRHQLERLDAAVLELTHHYGESLGIRRLRADVRRVYEDLDLLGPAPSLARPAAPAGVVEQLPDTPYDPAIFEGAEDEGLGGLPGRVR
jgi:hypothetical protein